MNVVYSPLALEQLTNLWDSAGADVRDAIRAAASNLETDLLRQPRAGTPVSSTVFVMVSQPLAIYYEIDGDSIRILNLRAVPGESVNGQAGDEQAVDVRRPDPEPLLWYPTELALRIAAREWYANEPPLPTDAELRQILAEPRFTIDEVLAGLEGV